ncbi:S-adenosylmethionine-dependent methyltransferase [Pyrus ussuriensis x Pyrus communis]|uniref:S-adenosylmethionine-dependent methyltransferase n=1 Tax=Pyrus ussuriensis x Pyrus communis TaxID=2448454 RepID=A0A5N5I3L8_9ROSA|nr:S-adenosylmethionine-dependent methyltransferase [Pyrus ussuriensis x Pyrus communis]
MSPQELKAAVERNGCFSRDSERMENLRRVPSLDNVTKSSQLLAFHVRAATKGLVKQQFGDKILDELFDLYRKRIEEQPSIFESGKAINLPIVLKHTKN